MCALTTSIKQKTMEFGQFIIVEDAISILVKPLVQQVDDKAKSDHRDTQSAK